RSARRWRRRAARPPRRAGRTGWAWSGRSRTGATRPRGSAHPTRAGEYAGCACRGAPRESRSRSRAARLRWPVARRIPPRRTASGTRCGSSRAPCRTIPETSLSPSGRSRARPAAATRARPRDRPAPSSGTRGASAPRRARRPRARSPARPRRSPPVTARSPDAATPGLPPLRALRRAAGPAVCATRPRPAPRDRAVDRESRSARARACALRHPGPRAPRGRLRVRPPPERGARPPPPPALRRCARPPRARPRGGEPCLHLGGIHLPLHALLPRRFLSGLELDQALPLTSQTLVDPHALHVVRFDLAVQRAEPGLHFRQAGRQALHLRGRVGGLALRVDGGALGVALQRSRLELVLTGPLRRLAGRRERGFRRGEVGERALG